MAKKLGIELSKYDIQRAHRLGKKKTIRHASLIHFKIYNLQKKKENYSKKSLLQDKRKVSQRIHHRGPNLAAFDAIKVFKRTLQGTLCFSTYFVWED